jgi:hypothetical protein
MRIIIIHSNLTQFSKGDAASTISYTYKRYQIMDIRWLLEKYARGYHAKQQQQDND